MSHIQKYLYPVQEKKNEAIMALTDLQTCTGSNGINVLHSTLTPK